MKIVLLGYTGSIGQHILKSIIKDNIHEVFCVGRKYKKNFINNKKIKYFKWDYKSFENSIPSFLIEANIIINCVGITNSNSKNLKYFNVTFVKNLINYIEKFNLKIRFIHLSSASVYGQTNKLIGTYKNFREYSRLKNDSLYSESKVKAEKIVKYNFKKGINKNYSYTILRISNVIGTKNKSNLSKFVSLSFKLGFWIKCSENILFNFIHVKDVAKAVNLVVTNLKNSRNKVYNVSNDCSQKQCYENYKKIYQKNLIEINISTSLLNFFYNLIPLPQKIQNLFLLISSQISYCNNRIKKELGFKPMYCLDKDVRIIDE